MTPFDGVSESLARQSPISQIPFGSATSPPHIGLLWMHPSGHLQEINTVLASWLGISTESLAMRKITLAHFIRNEERPREAAARKAALERGATLPLRITLHSGLALDLSLANLHNQLLIGYLWNPQLQSQLQGDLKTTQRRLHFLLRATQAGYFEIHRHLQEGRISQRLANILGYHLSELPGFPELGSWLFQRLHPEDLAECQTLCRDFFEGRLLRLEKNFRLRNRHQQWRWVQCTAMALQRDSTNRPIWMTGLLKDITSEQLSQENLRQAKQTAEAANRAKDQFLAVLSHELRTPLTPVLMNAQYLERETTLTSQQRQMVETIRRNVELEARLIDDLLDLTRISRGKLELQKRLVDLHLLLDQVLSICATDMVSKHLRIERDFQAQKHVVEADPARLQQILWNLLKNATKFTPAGGSIFLRTAQISPGEILVEVRDTGIGIAAEVMPVIFDAFEQGAPKITRQFGGLGLGLTISKALVEMHGGRIEATSPGPGQGATFQVVMNLAAEQTISPPQRPVLERPSSLRILLVEDHRDTRETTMRLLNSLGCQVLVASSLAEATALGKSHSFDLLLSDIGLPDGSGLDLLGQWTGPRPTKCIALSGYGMEDDIQRSRAAGFDLHLIKPVDIQVLQNVLLDMDQNAATD